MFICQDKINVGLNQQNFAKTPHNPYENTPPVPALPLLSCSLSLFSFEKYCFILYKFRQKRLNFYFKIFFKISHMNLSQPSSLFTADNSCWPFWKVFLSWFPSPTPTHTWLSVSLPGWGTYLRHFGLNDGLFNSKVLGNGEQVLLLLL